MARIRGLLFYLVLSGLTGPLQGSCVAHIQSATGHALYLTPSEIRKNILDPFIEKTGACKNASAFHDAVLKGNTTEVKRLLDEGYDSHTRDKYGYTPLYCAFYLGDAETARLFFAVGERLTLPMSSPPSGIFEAPPLQIIALYDDPSLTNLLFEYEGTNEIRNSSKYLELLGLLVARNGYKTLPLILNTGKKFRLVTAQVLTTALEDGLTLSEIPLRLDLLLPFFLNAGLKIDQRTEFNGTLLHSVACRNGIYGTANIHALLKAGASLHSRSTIGETPFLAAVKCRSVDGIRTLLKAGAALHDKDFRNKTGLHYAAESKNAPGVTQILLEAGAQYDTRDVSQPSVLPLPLSEADFEHLIAFLSDEVNFRKIVSAKNVECSDQIRQWSMCSRKSAIPSQINPANYFEQQDSSSALCASQVKALETCIRKIRLENALNPVIRTLGAAGIVGLISYPLLRKLYPKHLLFHVLCTVLQVAFVLAAAEKVSFSRQIEMKGVDIAILLSLYLTMYLSMRKFYPNHVRSCLLMNLLLGTGYKILITKKSFAFLDIVGFLQGLGFSISVIYPDNRTIPLLSVVFCGMLSAVLMNADKIHWSNHSGTT